MKKLITIFLVFTACIMSQTAVAPAGGDGSEDNPYQITNLENLYWITSPDSVVPEPNQKTRWSSHYIQKSDIDASETNNWFDGKGWSPIGNDKTHFTGTYNGQDHIVDGLYINRPNTNNIGFLGYLIGAAINNLGVANIDITGNKYVGGLVGYNYLYSTVINSYSTGIVNANGRDSYVGGLVGINWKSSISNSFSTADVNGAEDYVGGLVGWNRNNSTIISSYSSGSVNGEDNVGGLVGYDYQSQITNSYSTGNVDGETDVGGLVGDVNYSTVKNSFYNYEEVLINKGHVIRIGGLDKETYSTWYKNGLSLNINDYLSFDGENYLINTFKDLEKLLAFGQFEQHCFLLTSDIDLSAYSGFYIPYFVGEFDGNGYEIYNLTLNMSSFSNIGMFGYSHESAIRNLGIINADITGEENVGGLVGMQENSTIINSYSIGDIKGVASLLLISTNIGGLAGKQLSSSISNCYSAGTMRGTYCVGGLVGIQENSAISACYSTGEVTGPDYNSDNIGGLVGWNYNNSTIINCFSRGKVDGKSYVGGLVGHNTSSTANNSYWNTQTSGQLTSDVGKGRTTVYMTYPYGANTYVDWDFEGVWLEDVDGINDGYPFLNNVELVGIDNSQVAVPQYFLLQNYPNPFNSTTNIQYNIQKDSNVKISIYNIKGQLFETLINSFKRAGSHTIKWNAGELSSGVYFYKIKADNFMDVKSCILLK